MKVGEKIKITRKIISKFATKKKKKKPDEKSVKNPKNVLITEIIGFQESMDYNIVIQGSGALLRGGLIHHII